MNKILALLFFTTIILQGCGPGKPLATSYYILEPPADFEAGIAYTMAPLKRSCIILPVEVSPAYSSNQIAIRGNTHEIQYFTFNQWAVRPEQSLTAIITDFLLSHNVFESVSGPALHMEPDYIFETTVFHLEIISERRDHQAHLSLEYRLRDNKSGQILLNHRASRKDLLHEKNLNLFSAAISKIFVEELSLFANKILTDLR
jgi:ABC-type uncharacterized transport system auxiliary subunit